MVLRHAAVVLCAMTALGGVVHAAEHCSAAAASPALRSALEEIAASVDPCGESTELRVLVERFRACGARARLCVDDRAARNVTESGSAAQPTTVTWNPRLRTELEPYCAATAGPLLRDPTASLLHEIVHVVQDCDGFDIAAHELEAVRIENIFRRARGLCQRSGYGDQPLPEAERIACAPGDCPCTPADDAARRGVQSARATDNGTAPITAFDATTAK